MIKESKVRLVTIEKLKGQVDEFLKVRLLRPNHMLLRTHTLSLSARYRSPDKSSGPCQPFDIRDERHTYTVNEVFLPADYILYSAYAFRRGLSVPTSRSEPLCHTRARQAAAWVIGVELEMPLGTTSPVHRPLPGQAWTARRSVGA